MHIIVPVPSQAPGPDWATTIAGDMTTIDGHDHSSGKGAPVTPAGLDISSDLSFGSNNATNLKSALFTPQGSPLAGATDIGCIYVSGFDLYYNDTTGQQVRITTGGNVNAGAGSISGLPSGTASVAFSGGTYTFQSATNTGATISCGPVAIGSTTASAKHTTIASNATQVADISLTLPVVAPTSNTVMASDNAGNMFWDSVTGTGAIVRTNSATINDPIFTGIPTGRITGGTYTPTITSSVGASAATGAWFYQRIGNIIYATGTISVTPSGGIAVFTATLPVDPTNNFSNTYDASAVLGNTVSSGTLSAAVAQAHTGAKNIICNLLYSSDTVRSITLAFTYSCA